MRMERRRSRRGIIVRLQATYPDGPVVVTLRSEGESPFGPRRLGFFTEFALRRRLTQTQRRTREQIDEIIRKLYSEPYECEFEESHASWGAALDAWNGVGTPLEVDLVQWSCRKPGCSSPLQRTPLAAMPDQVVLLECQACESLRRVDPAIPE
jgi:hypothetical protein